MYSTTWSSVFQLYNKTKRNRTSRQTKRLFIQFNVYVCWLIIITPGSIYIFSSIQIVFVPSVIPLYILFWHYRCLVTKQETNRTEIERREARRASTNNQRARSTSNDPGPTSRRLRVRSRSSSRSSPLRALNGRSRTHTHIQHIKHRGHLHPDTCPPCPRTLSATYS